MGLPAASPGIQPAAPLDRAAVPICPHCKAWIVAAGWHRMAVVAVLIVATLLAACSGSSRVEHVVPAWANTPTRPALQFAAGKARADDRGKSDAEPQPAKPPPAQSHSEE